MRILVVDVNFEYKNPTYRQFYTSLLNCMDVDFFGPGYVSRECLEKGINKYLSENEDYDAILLGTYFVYSSGEKGTRYNSYQVHRWTIPYYRVNDAYQCCGRILDELRQIRDIVKIYLYYEDFGSMPAGDRAMCVDLRNNDFYILSCPIEYMNRYSLKVMNQFGLTNYAYDLVEEYGDYYIPIPLHGIGYNEIFIRNFFEREYEWCIPGNKLKCAYPERSKAEDMLGKNGKNIYNDDPYQKLSTFTIERRHMEWYKFRNKAEMFATLIWGKNTNIPSQPKMQYIAACREQYLESMRSSRFVYAEGGGWNCFVRKYFEACACGAVLVAKRVSGMSEMGFIHNRNCIIVEKYEDILGVDKKYTIEQLKKIAKEGQELIINKHMFVHRAEALAKTIDAIMKGVYKGAFWEDGTYIMK